MTVTKAGMEYDLQHPTLWTYERVTTNICEPCPGGLLNAKLGIDCETDWEIGSAQSLYRRGSYIPTALHWGMAYKIRWLQWPCLNIITGFLLIYNLMVKSTLGQLANNWSGGYTYASFESDEIPKMMGRKSHTRYLHSQTEYSPPPLGGTMPSISSSVNDNLAICF